MIALSVLMAITFFVQGGSSTQFQILPHFHFNGKIRYFTIYNRDLFFKTKLESRTRERPPHHLKILEKDDVIDLTQSPQLLLEAFWLPPEF